jgi:hypothetical protein
MARSFDRIKPGLTIDRQTAATLNRALDLLEALALPRSTGEVGLVGRPGGISISDQRPFPEPWWVSIDDVGVTSSRYEAWTRVEDQGDGSFALADDEQVGGPEFPAFVPDGWPQPAIGSVCPAIASTTGDALLLLTPAAQAGTALHPTSVSYGPYLTQTYVGPDVSIDLTDIGVVVNLGEVYFQALRVSWAADQDDYDLDRTITFLNVEPTASGVTLTGIQHGANGRLLYVVNRDALQDLTLAHDSASSTAGNRLQLPTGADAVLGQNEGIALYYSETDSCWFALDEAAGGATAPAFSGARVYNSTNQTITGNGLTDTSGAILFASESFDTAGYHSTTVNTSRLTAPTTGYYRIGGHAWITLPTGVTTAVLGIYLNGTTPLVFQSATDVAGQTVDCIVGDVYHLTAGDYVELVAAIRVGTGNFTVPGSGGVSAPVFWIEFCGT